MNTDKKYSLNELCDMEIKYLKEESVILDEINLILKEISDMSVTVGKDSAKVMFDIKYQDQLVELTKKQKAAHKKADYFDNLLKKQIKAP